MRLKPEVLVPVQINLLNSPCNTKLTDFWNFRETQNGGGSLRVLMLFVGQEGVKSSSGSGLKYSE